MAAEKLAAREKRLADLADNNLAVDLYSGSPCLFCLDTTGKLPWRRPAGDASVARALPVLMSI
jgi:outer membrane protein assembly factor BamB